MALTPTTHYSFIVRSIDQFPVLRLTTVDSGHGGQVKDKDGDEVDGFDEGPR